MKRFAKTLFIAMLLPLLQGWTLREGHPRIYFTADDMPLLQGRMTTSHADQWNSLYGYAERRLSDPAGEIASQTYPNSPTEGLAFVCLFSGEARFCSHARDILIAMAEMDPTAGGGDTAPRNRMRAMGLGFDWIYDFLSAAQRQTIIDGIKAHVSEWIDFVENPNFVGGHSRKGNYDIMVALAAIMDEAPEVESILDQVRNNYFDGYNPAQGWIAVDGGYHMGWAYGASYNTAVPYMTWETAVVDEDITQDWQMHLGYWFLYGLRGDGTYPREGDVFSINPSTTAALIVLRSYALGGDPYTGWLYDQWREGVMWDATYHYDIIYYDPSMTRTDPSGLPKARCFSNCGFLLARDRWDEETTHLSFKSASFLSINHNHLNNNHIELSYKRTLLLDTGQYDAYGTEHWKNYFVRTIAHNTLIVVDPDEDMRLYGNSVSNDGGQLFMSAQTLEQIAPGGDNHLDGMRRCEDSDGHAYALGDATKAYSSEKLGLFHRQVVYLRDSGSAWARPIVAVYDTVNVIKDGLYRAILWHLPSEPQVDENRISAAAEDEASVHLFVILPDPFHLETVGGPGREFFTDGANYPPEDTTPQEAGEWRVEVSPETPGERDTFLTVIFPAAAGEAAPAAPSTVQSDDAAGAAMEDRVVVFASSTDPVDELTYTVDCTSGRHIHRVFGLTGSTLFSVALDGTATTQTASTAHGSSAFEVDCGPGAAMEVTLGFLEPLPDAPPDGESADTSIDTITDIPQDGEEEGEDSGGGGCSCSFLP